MLSEFAERTETLHSQYLYAAYLELDIREFYPSGVGCSEFYLGRFDIYAHHLTGSHSRRKISGTQPNRYTTTAP